MSNRELDSIGFISFMAVMTQFLIQEFLPNKPVSYTCLGIDCASK
jgi:hypothetical protein